jgi:hypothetical protein
MRRDSSFKVEWMEVAVEVKQFPKKVGKISVDAHVVLVPMLLAELATTITKWEPYFSGQARVRF